GPFSPLQPRRPQPPAPVAGPRLRPSPHAFRQPRLLRRWRAEQPDVMVSIAEREPQRHGDPQRGTKEDNKRGRPIFFSLLLSSFVPLCGSPCLCGSLLCAMDSGRKRLISISSAPHAALTSDGLDCSSGTLANRVARRDETEGRL